MNETLKEQISAFVDGELPDNESELLVRRLSQDPELRELAARYFTVGRAVRAESVLPANSDLRSRVAAELGTEQPERLPTEDVDSGRYLRPLAGVAVAASVHAWRHAGRSQGSARSLPTARAMRGRAAEAAWKAARSASSSGARARRLSRAASATRGD